MGALSTIRADIAGLLEQIDAGSMAQGTGEVMRHALLDPAATEGLGYLQDHLTFVVSWTGTDTRERGRGSMSVVSTFFALLYFRIRPSVIDAFGDVDDATSLSELCAHALSRDLECGATCVVDRWAPLGRNVNGYYEIRLDLTVKHGIEVG